VLVIVCHEEESEVLDDRAANAVVGNPFDDRLGFDIAELLYWQFLGQGFAR